MKLPDKIKVGGTVYDIVFIKPKPGKLCVTKNWGEICLDECKIYISSDVDTQRQWQILMHEVIHAIEADNDMDSAECYIQTISCSFYAFLKDNNLLKE